MATTKVVNFGKHELSLFNTVKAVMKKQPGYKNSIFIHRNNLVVIPDDSSCIIIDMEDRQFDIRKDIEERRLYKIVNVNTKEHTVTFEDIGKSAPNVEYLFGGLVFNNVDAQVGRFYRINPIEFNIITKFVNENSAPRVGIFDDFIVVQGRAKKKYNGRRVTAILSKFDGDGTVLPDNNALVIMMSPFDRKPAYSLADKILSIVTDKKFDISAFYDYSFPLVLFGLYQAILMIGGDVKSTNIFSPMKYYTVFAKLHGSDRVEILGLIFSGISELIESDNNNVLEYGIGELLYRIFANDTLSMDVKSMMLMRSNYIAQKYIFRFGMTVKRLKDNGYNEMAMMLENMLSNNKNETEDEHEENK